MFIQCLAEMQLCISMTNFVTHTVCTPSLTARWYKVYNARDMPNYLEGSQRDGICLRSLPEVVSEGVRLLHLLLGMQCSGLRLLSDYLLLCQSLLQASHHSLQICSRKGCT